LKVMVDRAARWKFSWQQSPLAACPQEVKDGVEDGTKVGGARSRRRQNWRNSGPRRVGQVGVVESRVHRTVPLARVSTLSRQTSTFQTPSKTYAETPLLGLSLSVSKMVSSDDRLILTLCQRSSATPHRGYSFRNRHYSDRNFWRRIGLIQLPRYSADLEFKPTI
jgi:hypothetical protein